MWKLKWPDQQNLQINANPTTVNRITVNYRKRSQPIYISNNQFSLLKREQVGYGWIWMIHIECESYMDTIR